MQTREKLLGFDASFWGRYALQPLPDGVRVICIEDHAGFVVPMDLGEVGVGPVVVWMEGHEREWHGGIRE